MYIDMCIYIHICKFDKIYILNLLYIFDKMTV